MEAEADRINYKLRIDSNILKVMDRRENLRVRGAATVLTDDVGSSIWGPYEYLYAKFDLTVPLVSNRARVPPVAHVTLPCCCVPAALHR